MRQLFRGLPASSDSASGGGRSSQLRWSRHVRAATAVLVLLVAACGDDDDDGGQAATTVGGTATPATSGSAATDGSAAPSPEDIDRDGTLRLGFDMSNYPGDTTSSPNVTTAWIDYLVKGSLLRIEPDGSFTPALATAAEIVDPRTIEITLREGITYQDGTPYTAEAVKKGLERNFASPMVAASFQGGEYLNIESIEVTGDLTFTIHMKTDTAGALYIRLGMQDFTTTSPESPTFAEYPDTNPIGAGPYRWVSFTPGESLTLERWDDYYDASSIAVKRVEIINLASTDAMVTAMQSGQIDYIYQASPALLDSLQGVDGLVIEQYQNPEWTGTMYITCKRFPAWSDPRVRQAFNLAIDRDALNNTLFGGKGEPLDTIFGSSHRLYNPELAGANDRDVERAKQLLAEADFDGKLEVTLGPGDITTQRAYEVIQEQVKEAGIDLEISQSSNIVQEMFVEHTRPALIAVTGVANFGITRLTSTYLAGNNGNSCEVGAPAPDGTPPSADETRMQEIIAELSAMDPTSEDVVPLWHEAQELNSRNVWHPQLVSPPYGHVYRENLGGIAEIPLSAQFGPDVISVYVKKG